MPANPSTTVAFLDLVRRSGIVRPDQLDDALRGVDDLPDDPVQSAAVLVRKGVVTKFQAKLLLAGRYRGFKLGPYVILEQLGQGGMGAVYLAEHENLKRKVALKVLATPGKDTNAKLSVERFLREARAAAALDHPNIVRIHDVTNQGATYYLVMEYVEGQSLEELIEKGGAVSPGRAVGYIAQAAAGLQHAHEKGFVHRDIKPANLILAKDGTVKILDMGLARSFAKSEDKLTERLDVGAIVGTADFIAPEQAVNDPNIDHRADVYSLGATFFALVTGKPPFHGNTTQKLVQHQMKDAPSLASIDRTFPKGLSDVAAKMMAKKPEKRYRSAADVVAALAPWLSNDGGTRVVAGMSNTDISAEMQNTLSELVGGSTQRLNRASGRLAGGKKPNAAVVASAGVAALCAVGLVSFFLMSGAGGQSEADKAAEQAAADAAAQTEAKKSAAKKAAGKEPPAAKPTQQPTAVARPADTRPPAGALFHTDFAGCPPAKVVVQARGSNANDTAALGLPPAWSVNQFTSASKDVAGEYSVADVGGVRALGVRQTAGTIGSQLQCKCDEVLTNLKPGESVVLRVVYRFDGTGVGGAGAQLQSAEKKYPKYGATPLPPTGGRWQAVDIPFTRPEDDGKYTFLFNTGMHGVSTEHAEGTLWLKSVDVLPPAPSGLIYRLDLSGAAPVALRGGCEFPPEFPGDRSKKRFVLIEQTGTGELPAGWRGRPLSPGQQGTIGVYDLDGGPAMGLNALTPNGLTMFFSPEMQFNTQRVRVRFEYLAKGGQKAVVRFKQLQPTEREAHDIQVLTASGRWEVAEIDLDLQGATTGFVEFHTNARGPDGGLWFRGLTITDPTAAAVAAVPEKPVFRLDAADILPFKNRKLGRKVEDGTSESLPAGVYLVAWKSTTEAAFSREIVEGVPALAWANLAAPATAQLAVDLERESGVNAALTPGKSYRLRVAYRTTGSAFGKTYFQRYKPDGSTGATAGTADLPNTGGEWRKVETTVTREDARFRFLIDNQSIGEGNVLYVREVVLTEADSTAPAAPSAAVPTVAPPAAPAVGGKVGAGVYKLDLGGVPPFRATLEHRTPRDGVVPPLPAGVAIEAWRTGGVGQFGCVMADGGKALAVTNLNDEKSGQVAFDLAGLAARLTPGRKYRATVECQTKNDAVGFVAVQTEGLEWLGSADLRPGNGWRRVAVTFTYPATGSAKLVVENKAVGEGNTLLLRSFELHELAD